MGGIREIVRKLSKDRAGIRVGITDPPGWISTGCHALDWLMSGRLEGGVPYGQITAFVGKSGSGKSLIASGHLVRNALADGASVVVLDTENAISREWLSRVGIDPDHERLVRIGATVIEEVAPFVYQLLRDWRARYGDLPFEERPRLLLVIDSLGMLPTQSDVEGLEQGQYKDDHGRRAKRISTFMRTLVGMAAATDAAVVFTNHVYDSQDSFRPDPVQAGGSYMRYGPTIVVRMSRAKLRASEGDWDGGGSGIAGIRSVCMVEKTRWAREFEKVEIQIPYDGGLNPWSGFVEVMERAGLLKHEGRKYVWESPEGRVSLWKKEWERNRDGWSERLLRHAVESGVAAHRIGGSGEGGGADSDGSVGTVGDGAP